MPVSFLNRTQREQYGQYSGSPTAQELSRYFHLDDSDHLLITKKRAAHNRLGFAVQLCTLRYLGTFISDIDVPHTVIETISNQLNLVADVDLDSYRNGNQHWIHADEIRQHYGFTDITERRVAFTFSRWLYALCWTGTDRPSVLFERARYWLLSHKVILPGYSTLERFIAKVRSRVEARVWQTLISDVTPEQKVRLAALLIVTPGESRTEMEKLRKGPVSISAQSVLHEIKRLQSIRSLHTPWHFPGHVPDVRIMSLARYANTAKAVTIRRMSEPRKVATLRALIASLSISAQDDILVVLEQLLRKIFSESLVTAVDRVTGLIRPKNDVHFSELDERYRTIHV